MGKLARRANVLSFRRQDIIYEVGSSNRLQKYVGIGTLKAAKLLRMCTSAAQFEPLVVLNHEHPSPRIPATVVKSFHATKIQLANNQIRFRHPG